MTKQQELETELLTLADIYEIDAENIGKGFFNKIWQWIEQYGTEQRVAENNYWIDKEDVESDEVVFVRKNDFEKRIIELNERS